MPSDVPLIRGILKTAPPPQVVRCGLSLAGFAQHCLTHQWYELSQTGQSIGRATDFDFYRSSQTVSASRATCAEDQVLPTTRS